MHFDQKKNVIDPDARAMLREESAKDKRLLLRMEMAEKDSHRQKRASKFFELLDAQMREIGLPDLNRELILETARLEIVRGEDHTKVLGFCNQAMQQYCEAVQKSALTIGGSTDDE